MFGSEGFLPGRPLDCSNIKQVLPTVVDYMSRRDSGASFLTLEANGPWITDFLRKMTKFLAENENTRKIFNSKWLLLSAEELQKYSNTDSLTEPEGVFCGFRRAEGCKNSFCF